MSDVFVTPSEAEQHQLWERACSVGICITFPPSSEEEWGRMVDRVCIIEAMNEIDTIHEMKEMVADLNTNLTIQWERYTTARDVLDRVDPSNWHPRYMELARKEEANSCMDMLLYSVMHERGYWKLKMMRSSCKYISLLEPHYCYVHKHFLTFSCFFFSAADIQELVRVCLD
jgi:hypothetical protein